MRIKKFAHIGGFNIIVLIIIISKTFCAYAAQALTFLSEKSKQKLI